MRLATTALTLTIIALAAAPAHAATALGFNDDPAIFADDAERARNAGATVARIPVNWALVEREAASQPGSELLPANTPYRGKLDAAVAALTSRGITPMFAIFSAPDYAAGSCKPKTAPPRTCGVAAGYADEYARFGAGLLRRYPGALIQSWNEPDIRQFGAMSPERVAEITNALSAAVPWQVIGPATSPGNDRGARYTRRAYRLIDRKVPMAMHFYPRSPVAPDGYRPDWREGRRFARKQQRSLWVTEIGYASSSYGLAGQARELARAYRYLASHGASVVIVHRLRDVPAHDSPWLSSMGLIDQSGSPKPAYRALATAAARTR